MKSIKINNRTICTSDAPYIIAEMSANHNGDIKNAFKIIDEAQAAGADAIKIQTYTADTITLPCTHDEFRITEGLWSGQTLHELYSRAHMPWSWHKTLFEYARDKGITIFSSPFDKSAVDLLEDLNTPAYKIASFEAIDLPLIDYVARTGKPMIISTGMANSDEIYEAVETARSGGCHELALLHCISGYPASPEDYNLNTLIDMKTRFDTVVGLSDHTLDNTIAIASVALGASIIEKHFTLDRHGGGPDDSFSMEPADLRALCRDAKVAWHSMGKVDYTRKESELGNVKFRRSLYFVKDMKPGEIITAECIRSIRPGFGLAPKFLNKVIGSRTACAVRFGTPVTVEKLDSVEFSHQKSS